MVKYAFKFILSVAALWLVFGAVPADDIVSQLSAFDWHWALPSVLCLHGSHIISALRVRDSLAAQQRPIGIVYALRLHYIGTMFNILLPTSIGGDGYKAWQLAKRFDCKLIPMAAVMLSNRANGLLLLFVLLAALLLAHDGLADAAPYYRALILAGLGVVALTYHLAAKMLWKESFRFQLRLSAFSFGVQAMMLVSVLVLLQGFAGVGSHIDYLIVMLLSSIVSILPVSIGGIGLRELLLLKLAPYLSMDTQQAVAIGAAYSLVHISISLVGVLVYWSANAKKMR